jgi:hypothetical protein
MLEPLEGQSIHPTSPDLTYCLPAPRTATGRMAAPVGHAARRLRVRLAVAGVGGAVPPTACKRIVLVDHLLRCADLEVTGRPCTALVWRRSARAGHC